MSKKKTNVELLSIKWKTQSECDILEKCKESKFNKTQLTKIQNDHKEYNNNNNNNNKDNDHNNNHHFSETRFIELRKSLNKRCGFRLTRTNFDPYPWVTDIDRSTPAEYSGLKIGDCIIEVNGCNVLGLSIKEIAKLVETINERVTLLVWSSRCDSSFCHPHNICAAPMQRLSLIVQNILSIIECPICLDTIRPPALQCRNGHLFCVNCRIHSEKCPLCREYFSSQPVIVAEKIYLAISNNI